MPRISLARAGGCVGVGVGVGVGWKRDGAGNIIRFFLNF